MTFGGCHGVACKITLPIQGLWAFQEEREREEEAKGLKKNGASAHAKKTTTGLPQKKGKYNWKNSNWKNADK